MLPLLPPESSALIELPLSAYRLHGRNDYTMLGSGDGFWNGSEDADVRSRAVRHLALSTFLNRAEQFAWYLGERFFDCISQFDAGRAWLRGRVLTDPQALAALGQAYERMCGIHLSLGAKHGLYNKPQIRRATARHHVDVFAVTEAVYLDEQIVYQNGAWQPF